MTRRHQDTQTRDLFEVPRPHNPVPGSHDFRSVVAGLVSDMLDHAFKTFDKDRYAVAAEMSRLVGKEVSKYMLDAYSSPAREEYNIPFYLLAALEVACESYEATQWLSGTRGAKLLVGREAYDAEMGRLQRVRDDATKRIREIQKITGGSDDART